MKRKKGLLDNKVLFSLIIIVLLVLAIFGLFFAKSFIGYMGYMMNATAGHIYEITINHVYEDTYWAGRAGLFSLNLQDDLEPITVNVSGGNVSKLNLEFDCFGNTGDDIYLSEIWYEDISYPVTAATVVDVEDYLLGDNTSHNAPVNTLTENISVNFGGTVIETIGFYTKQKSNSSSTDFDMFVLKDSNGILLFGTHVNALSEGYDGSLVNYQFMWPVPTDETNKGYYIYGDPISDPYGECAEVKRVLLYGYAFDNETGLPLANVTVKVSAQIGTTDANGYYSVLVEEGEHYVIGEKDGYFDHVGNVTLVFGFPQEYNFSMYPTYGLGQPVGVGFINGTVLDEDTGLPLANVTVSSGSNTTLTDANGTYNLVAFTGNLTLIAVKPNYDDHFQTVTVELLETITVDINLTPMSGLMPTNGTITGIVKDGFNGQPIENAVVSIGRWSNITDSNGNYSILVPSGDYMIAATKTNYLNYVNNVSIIAYNTTYHNISMTYYGGIVGRNGTLYGKVVDGSTGLGLDNVLISSGGYSTYSLSDGNYSLDVPSGNHTVVFQKDDYGIYVATIWIDEEVNVSYNALLSHTEPGDTVDYESINKNLTEYIPEHFNFTLSNTSVEIVTNENITNAQIDVYSFEEYPDSTIPVDFYSIGKFFEFLSDVPMVNIENVTFKIPYNESLFPAGINVSDITIFYFNATNNEWIELNTTIDIYNRLIYVTNHFSVYVVGAKRPIINGTVVDSNTGLALENTTVYYGGNSMVTGVDGAYSLTVTNGSDYLIAIKTDYFNYINLTNVDLAERLQKDIEMEEYAEPGLGPGLGPGVGPGRGPGLGPGQGPGTGIPADEDEANPNALEIYTSLDTIKKKVRRDSFVEESLTIYNFKEHSSELYFNVSGSVAPHVDLNVESALIQSQASMRLIVRLLGNGEPGLYMGRLKISGDMDAVIPIELTITNEGKIPLKSLILKIDSLQKSAYRGEEFRYKVDMINLLTGSEFDVHLNFTLSNLNRSKILYLGTQDARVQTFTSLLRKANLPADLELGDYRLSVEADYVGYKATANTLFVVADPFYKYNLFGVLPIWLLSTFIGFFSTGFFIFVIIKKQKEKNKRFHATVDYKALPKPGDRSLFCGFIAETKKKFFMDMDKLTVHSIVAGSTGGGKSISAQDIVEECLIKGASVCVFDPTAQWSGMLRKLADKKFLSFYAPFGMNPKKDPRAFPGNIKAIKDHREIVDIFKYMKTPGEIQVFTTNTLDPKNYDVFVANMIRQIFHSKLDEFRVLRYLVVFDEIHRILPKFGGSGEGFLQIERGCREFRKWGIGILLISQVLSDFVGEIKANINTLVQMKTRDDGDLNRIKMQYGEEFIQSLVKSPVGSGMVQNAAYNHGQPFYVTFRPILHSVVRLKDEELEEYNKWNEVLEQLDYEFDQLEEEKQDVFDLRLEMKLARDKVKGGNFNMVKIYLDGLTPRITKVWDKIGKKPKKLEIQLVSEDEMKAEMEAAKKAKAEQKAKEKAEGGGEEEKKEEEPDVELSEDEMKDNLKQIDKLFADVDEAIEGKDWFSINDRFIEATSVPLPKKEKAKVNERIEEAKKKVEEAKKAAEGGGDGAKPAEAAAEAKSDEKK